MNDLQMKLLDMFQWFHTFCERENLTYFALGGTALGAFRHKGFIPWDDDIDLGMPRPDYERMISIIQKKPADSRYIIEYPLEKEDSMYAYCKIYDTRTTLIENVKNKPKRGIFIDLFPLDGIGDTEHDGRRHYKKILFFRNILNMRNCEIRKKRKFYKNFSVAVFKLIPEWMINKKTIIQKIENMAVSRNYDTSNYVANIYGAWKEKEISPKEWFGTPQLYEFESANIYMPEQARQYLTALYGNYMQLPPAEKRISHHDYLYLDLDTPYINL